MAVGVESGNLLAAIALGNGDAHVDKFGQIVGPSMKQPHVFLQDMLKYRKAAIIPRSGVGDFELLESMRSQREYGEMDEFLIKDFEKMLETLGSTHTLPESMGCDNLFKHVISLWNVTRELLPCFTLGVQHLQLNELHRKRD